ncbi:MAG TPA: VWA domain-containing protein, partial [Gammaproteobacteria bacterium]|nr:VWA domain-containing protein [Gammaproteobacteria bacterium]
MAGTSIRQARRALLNALDRLKAGDRFNIIQFNSRTSRLFHVSQPVGHGTLRQARSWIHMLEAGGGTEMAPALQAALENNSEHALVRQIVFITDGSIGNESQLFSIIEGNLGKSRLFTIGIGSAPNSYFMRRAAEIGKGSYTFIGQIADVEERMQTLFSKLESPVLTDLALDHDGQEIAVWPERIPDLYKGEPLLLTVKARQLPASIHINGKIGDENWQSSLPLNGAKNSAGIARLWAHKKITALLNRWHLGDDREKNRQMIIETALEHHLVSRFTSLVAIDKTPSRVREALLQSRAVPVNLPNGWQYEKVFGQLPATATPATLHLLFGLLLLVASMLLTLFYNHVRYL